MKYWEDKSKGKILPIAKFEIKTNGNGSATNDVHEIVVFGDEAERLIEKNLTENDYAIVRGRLKSKIQDNRRIHEVYARTVEKAVFS